MTGRMHVGRWWVLTGQVMMAVGWAWALTPWVLVGYGALLAFAGWRYNVHARRDGDGG